MRKTKMITAAIVVTGFGSVAQAQPMDPWGDDTVSRADAQKAAEERFAAADTDHDGVISEDERSARRGDGHRGPGGGGMRRADKDGDGRITREEFLAAQLERFDSQDADKDSQLTRAERDAARTERMRDGGGWGGPPPGGE